MFNWQIFPCGKLKYAFLNNIKLPISIKVFHNWKQTSLTSQTACISSSYNYVCLFLSSVYDFLLIRLIFQWCIRNSEFFIWFYLPHIASFLHPPAETETVSKRRSISQHWGKDVKSFLKFTKEKKKVRNWNNH